MEIKEVFEPVLNFIKNLQKKDKEPTSKKAAKDRLKLVLMQDRASVSPDFFEMMKKEIIDVIKKYIEIDEEALEVQLTRGLEAGLEGPALYANIPIKNVKPVAPKADGDDGEDMVPEEMLVAGLTEEEADKVADTILEQIENAAEQETNNSKEKKEDIEAENVEKLENVETESEEKTKKATTRKRTVSKATTKKATTSKTTKKKKTE